MMPETRGTWAITIHTEVEMATKRSNILSRQFVAGIIVCGAALTQTGLAQTGSAQPGPLTGLAPDHATISVENVDRVAGWYERILGFKIANRFDTDPGFLLEQLSIPGYRIDLVKYKGSTRPAQTNPVFLQQGWVHVVFNSQDLPAALKQLQALNVTLTSNKDPDGALTRIVLHDPEGNEVEVVRRK
jgi:catechol 2,3-dioxygenase-like lactoylglutathione lyase family enzyme